MIFKLKDILREHFSDCEKTITEISANNPDNKFNRLFYISNVKLYCLDSIVEKHFKIEPKSADAIHVTDKSVVFIEFKEGHKKNIKAHDIKLKLFEAFNSLFKVIKETSDEEVCRADFWGMDFIYIVVYRDDEKLESIKSKLDRSEIKWGLDEYDGFYLKSSITEFCPQSVKFMLNRLTDGACNSLHYVTPS